MVFGVDKRMGGSYISSSDLACYLKGLYGQTFKEAEAFDH